jgi:hypothetical protein
MATTTNYGWGTPDDTDLVKDGALAIRDLGQDIDTTTKNLNPETTTGDIAYRSATTNTNTRLALGTAGQVLTVNSGATAPEWATPSAGATNEAVGYKWDMWNPTNNSGTVTNAPSTGTSSGNTTNISLANSSGTVTFTLGAGTYLVSTTVSAQNTAEYTYEAVLAYIAGTATSYQALAASPNNFLAQWGEGDQDGDPTFSANWIVTATASQTVTILPAGRTSGPGATSAYDYYATATIVRI